MVILMSCLRLRVDKHKSEKFLGISILGAPRLLWALYEGNSSVYHDKAVRIFLLGFCKTTEYLLWNVPTLQGKTVGESFVPYQQKFIHPTPGPFSHSVSLERWKNKIQNTVKMNRGLMETVWEHCSPIRDNGQGEKKPVPLHEQLWKSQPWDIDH